MAGLEDLFLNSQSNAPKLRIVVLADSPTLGRPEAAALHHIVRSNFASLVAVVLAAETAGPKSRAAPWHTLAFRLVEGWGRVVNPDVHALTAPVDCSEILTRLPTLPCMRDGQTGTLTFSTDTISALQGLKPDVILRGSSGPIPEELSCLARFGVWSIHLGEPGEPRSTTPYFKEVQEGRLLSSVALLLHGGPEGGVHVLTQALVATEHSLFRGKNCVRPVLTALTFVIRKLRDLHLNGWEAFAHGLSPGPVQTKSPPQIAENLKNRAMVKFLAPRVAQRAVNLVRRPPLTFRWRIAVRTGFPHKLTEQASAEGMAAFRWITPPQGGYFADPFLLRRQGKLWLFCEEVSYSERKGALSCMEVLPDGSLSESVRILTQPYHLSYPAVFEAEGEMFMIPETVGSGNVELYRAVAFPYSWVKERDLLPIRAVDSTPFVFEGRYWLFVTAVDPAEASYQLLLFHSSRLDGDWVLHPSCPLSLDVRCARSAGAIVSSQGKLYRPSQDCAPYYGHQLNFHEITRLDTRGYEERLAHTVGPDAWAGLRGVHTYACCGDVEVIDGQR